VDYYPGEHGGTQDLEKQFLELFSEQSPDERSGTFPTLEAAIQNFDREFGDAE